MRPRCQPGDRGLKPSAVHGRGAARRGGQRLLAALCKRCRNRRPLLSGLQSAPSTRLNRVFAARPLLLGSKPQSFRRQIPGGQAHAWLDSRPNNRISFYILCLEGILSTTPAGANRPATEGYFSSVQK